MVRLAVALDPDLGIGADALAASWDADEGARSLGQAEVEPAGTGVFLPGSRSWSRSVATIDSSHRLIHELAFPLRAVSASDGCFTRIFKQS